MNKSKARRLKTELDSLNCELYDALYSGTLDSFYNVEMKGLETLKDIKRAYDIERVRREKVAASEAFDRENLYGNDFAPTIPRTVDGLTTAGYTLREIVTKMWMKFTEVDFELNTYLESEK